MCMGFLGGSDGKESACNVGDPGSIPESGRSPGKWQPTPVFLLGKFQGHSRPSAYRLWGYNESDTTE